MRLLALLLVAAAVASEDRAAAWTRLLPELEQAMLPAAAADLRGLPPAPLVEIVASLDAPGDRVHGSQRVWWPNPTSAPLATIALRAPANAACFHGAALTISEVTWNGLALADPLANEDGTAWTWTLPAPLAVGEAGRLELSFSATASTSSGFHGLMQRTGERWCLYHWHPELPLHRDGAWQLPAVSGVGDESQAVLAHVVARLTLPAGLQVIAGGSTVARAAVDGDCERVTIAAPCCRNLAVSLARDLACDEVEAAPGVTVRSWREQAHVNAGARVLRVAAASLALFDRSFGAYPFRELDVVETLQGEDVGGMESSGLVLIDARPYEMCELLPDATGVEALPVLMLSEAVAHEVGHQWWYGLVGNDAFNEPWLDESLTNWSGGWALERADGPSARLGALNLAFMGVRMDPSGESKAMDLPLSGFTGMGEYGAVVYGRGSLMWEALRKRLGDEGFLAVLRAHFVRNRFAVADAAGLRATLAEALGDDEAGAFLAAWVHGDGLTTRMLIDVLKP
jgi:hypothetical protein